MSSLAEITVGGLSRSANPSYPALHSETAAFNATSHSSAFHELAMVGSPSRACRALNVIAAVVALVVCAPLMLILAVLVKLSSPGPIIYKQTRVGLDRRSGDGAEWANRRLIDYGGRLFTMYKFRTMRADPNTSVQIWARPGDARVTGIGRVLRKYRLDELPQLVNVLKGDMNIVGPRPEQPKIFLTLREEVESYAARQRVLPGITGWAQVNQSYDTSIDDVRRKVQLDLEYIRSQSVVQDLRILCQTIPVMLLKRGAW
jgi:lipopolysaccharide/colanic/teichoic acid biosynthesis glycosyltransferase